ncbi:MAG: M13 family metallopeptidase [Candidatus Spechtbacterales bacterium]
MAKKKGKNMKTTRKALIGDWGIDFKGFNTRVRPQDDLDEFVNGSWKQRTSIPKKEVRWGPFMELRERSNQAIKEILEDISRDSEASRGSDRQKLRDMYKLGMNARKLNRERSEPLAEEFASIDSIRNRGDLVKVIASLHLSGIKVFWNTAVHPDPSDSNVMILSVDQGGTSLPERGYYFDKDKEDIRKKFEKHVERIFNLLGLGPRLAKNASRTVLDIETNLAQKSWSSTKLRDIAPQLNYMKQEGLAELATGIDWRLYFEELDLEDLDKLMVGQIEFMQRVNSVIQNTNLDDIKTYMKWFLISRTAHLLSDDFVEESFDFWQKTLQGSESLKPRWQRCAAVIEGALGEALGQEYVQRHFPPEAKEKIRELVDNVMAVMRSRIHELDWMTKETKKKALKKLDAFETKLGYPDEWKDYSDFDVVGDSYVLDYLRARRFHSKDAISKVGSPVDPKEWHMAPQTVNAYFNPFNTEVVFPAAILQAPFFDPNADDAVNYGGIGVVIGHEITHGFDDKGSQFDKDGNFKNWWSKRDREEFEKRCKAVVEQFNGYEALPGLFVNGALTQGENIADLGGLSIAYEAYLQHVKSKPEQPILDGFTHKQRFFLGFAQVWRAKARDEHVKQAISTDPHSPPRFRVLGTLRNSDEFFEAFEVKEGDQMWCPPENRIKIW